MLPSEFLKSFIKKSEAILLKQNKTNNNKNGVELPELFSCSVEKSIGRERERSEI